MMVNDVCKRTINLLFNMTTHSKPDFHHVRIYEYESALSVEYNYSSAATRNIGFYYPPNNEFNLFTLVKIVFDR